MNEGSTTIDVPFMDILSSSDPAKAVTQIVVQFLLSTAAKLRALDIFDPALSAKAIRRIEEELRRIEDSRHDLTGSAVATEATKPLSLKKKTSVKNKTNKVLLREVRLLRKINDCKHGAGVRNSALLHEIQANHGEDISRPVLTTHLDHLRSEGYIERPRKGHYKATTLTAARIADLESEIAARQRR
jgi:DNA-binding transcriptional ArsR family regulator